jgi:hypothetical protein
LRAAADKTNGPPPQRSPRAADRLGGTTLAAIQTPARVSGFRRGGDMLWTIFVILAVMWLLGMVSSYTMGGFIHILLFLAVAVLLINLIQGRGRLAD